PRTLVASLLLPNPCSTMMHGSGRSVDSSGVCKTPDRVRSPDRKLTFCSMLWDTSTDQSSRRGLRGTRRRHAAVPSRIWCRDRQEAGLVAENETVILTAAQARELAE